jgi:RND family efflux transporter MFP subunit
MYTGQRPLAAILLVLFAIGLASCGSSARPAGPPPAKVKVATMAPKPIEESAIFIAELNSRRSVQLSPIVSGYLKAIAVKAGDQVKAGTLLFHIDSAREEAQLKNLLALREARQASLRLAEANYQRAQQLAPSGVVSEQELQQAATALASARADLAATEAQVSAQQAQVGYYRITAPFDGTLGDIPVKVGDFVNPTTVLTVLSQDGALEPYVRVPLSLAPKLGPDSRIELLDDSGRLLASGKVEFVSPTVDSSTQTVLIKTVIANAQQRVVQLGDIIGNDYVVQDGLKEGDQVVISGTQKVANGVPVQLET